MTPEPKQTAVELLRNQIAHIVHDEDHQELLDFCEKALKMEREQIKKENEYQFNLICELISIIEKPELSNQSWKDTIIEIAKEKGYGYKDN